MSSYSYQPKVFRFKNGCCICKAKSSSSRFTSSVKYEHNFGACFNLGEERSGKICNACVLIYKRWLKLPDRDSRHWGHVVNSKEKVGRKSTLRKRDETPEKMNYVKKHRYVSKRRCCYVEDLSDDQGLGEDMSSSSASSVVGEDRLSEGVASMPSSSAPSPRPITPYFMEAGAQKRKGPKGIIMRKLDGYHHERARSDFLTNSYWTEVEKCCGRVWEGRNKEVAVEPNFRYCESCSSSISSQCEPPILQKVSKPSLSLFTRQTERVNYNEQQMTYYNPNMAGMNMLLQFSQALVV